MTDIIANLGAARTKRPHRHQWLWLGVGDDGMPCQTCWCGARKDPAKSRAGKNNRNRGNAYEREVAAMLREVFPDAARKGQYGGPDDVTAGPLYIQAKKVAALYPKRLDDLLTETERHTTADQYPALALAHPGHDRRHKLVVIDVRDFVNLLRGVKNG